MIFSTKKKSLLAYLLLFCILFPFESAFATTVKDEKLLDLLEEFNPIAGTFSSYMDAQYGKKKWEHYGVGPIILVGASDAQRGRAHFNLTEDDILLFRNNIKSIRLKLYAEALKSGVSHSEFYVKKIDVLVEIGEGVFENSIIGGKFHYQAAYTSSLVYQLASFQFNETVLPEFSFTYKRHKYYRLAPVLHVYNTQTNKLQQIVLLRPSEISRTYLCAHCQWTLP